MTKELKNAGTRTRFDDDKICKVASIIFWVRAMSGLEFLWKGTFYSAKSLRLQLSGLTCGKGIQNQADCPLCPLFYSELKTKINKRAPKLVR